MNADRISVLSVDSIHCNEEAEENKSPRNISGLKDSSIGLTKSSSPNDENEPIRRLTVKDAGKCVAYSLVIIAASVLFAVPWTTIPRTDSIIYQSYWMEINIPMAFVWVLVVGTEMLNLSVWTQERSLATLRVFILMFSWCYITSILLQLMWYYIWSIHLGYYHPMQQLGVVTMMPTFLSFQIGFWILLPSHLLAKQDFKRKLRTYHLYFTFSVYTIIQNELLSQLFFSIPTYLQFLVPFIVAAFREFDIFMRSKLVDKMMGSQDEPAVALLEIIVNSLYAFFFAIRLAESELSTVGCVVAIDFILHLKMTYQIVKEHRKVKVKNDENSNGKEKIILMELILAELIEGLIPITHAIRMALAYYGPNSTLLANVGSSYWGTKIEDIQPLFVSMGVLFAFDTISAIVTSLWLWKVTEVNMLHEFNKVLSKYWLFMVVTLAMQGASSFASTDANFGGDTTGTYRWTEREGWLNIVNETKYLSDEEKMMLMNVTI